MKKYFILIFCIFGLLLSSCGKIVYPTYYKTAIEYKIHYPDTAICKNIEIFADTQIEIGATNGVNTIYGKNTKYNIYNSTAPFEIIDNNSIPYERITFKHAGYTISACIVEISKDDVNIFKDVYGYVIGCDLSHNYFPIFKYTSTKNVVKYYFPLLKYGLLYDVSITGNNIKNKAAIMSMKLN